MITKSKIVIIGIDFQIMIFSLSFTLHISYSLNLGVSNIEWSVNQHRIMRLCWKCSLNRKVIFRAFILDNIAEL